MSNIGIIGAGAWGIAIAKLLENNGHKLTIFSAITSEIDMLKEFNELTDKLPGTILSQETKYTTDIEEAVKDKDILVLAVASPYTKKTSALMAPFIKDGQIIVNVSKGIDDESLMTLSEVIESQIPNANVCVMSGPSHAEEVAKGLPTTIVVGSKNKDSALLLQEVFMSDVFRVYISSDVKSIELGAALKNVVALAAGIADGLGYGDNTKAALITRGIAEITRLGIVMGGRIETFYGLTGIGDLIVTCASVHSRNRRAGILIGQGMSYEEATKEVKQVVEGVYAARAGLALAKKYNVNVPIIEEVNKILFENANPADAVKELMERERKVENIDLRELYKNATDIPW